MLHYFNPGHETAVLNASPYYKPPAVQLKMREDLSFLPAWYAGANDFVWVEKELPADYRAFLNTHLGPMPGTVGEFNVKEYYNTLREKEVKFWGISPQGVYLFEQNNRKYELDLQIPAWKDEYRDLGSRREALSCLEYLVSSSPDISPDIIPAFYSSAGEIENAILSRPGDYLVKSPYSSSGRGLLWLPGGDISRSAGQILQGMIKRQSAVSLEKALNKVVDFSMQFFADGKGRVSFEGLSLFQTDAKGNYRGTFVHSQQKIRTFLDDFLSLSLVDHIQNLLIAYLSKRYASIYRGEIGVDLMVYEEDGHYCLHPCVEINMRTTMGYLALHLQKRLPDEETEGMFRLEFSGTPGEIHRRHQEFFVRYPLDIVKNKIRSGYLPLCPVTEERFYWAYLLVGEAAVLNSKQG